MWRKWLVDRAREKTDMEMIDGAEVVRLVEAPGASLDTINITYIQYIAIY